MHWRAADKGENKGTQFLGLGSKSRLAMNANNSSFIQSRHQIRAQVSFLSFLDKGVICSSSSSSSAILYIKYYEPWKGGGGLLFYFLHVIRSLYYDKGVAARVAICPPLAGFYHREWGEILEDCVLQQRHTWIPSWKSSCGATWHCFASLLPFLSAPTAVRGKVGNPNCSPKWVQATSSVSIPPHKLGPSTIKGRQVT